MSDQFAITVESPEPWQRVLKVRVPRAEYDRQYQQRLTTAVRNHQRPGFRKGKTPRALVEKEVGERLRADTFQALVPQAYRAGVVEHQLFAITEPKLENLTFDDDGDLAFDLEVEVRPEVTARDYEGLPVTERAPEVGDDEVAEMLERMRQSRAIQEAVDRPGQDGDQLVVDLAPLDDAGEPQEERRMTGQRLTLGAETNLPAFNEALAGTVAGQELTIAVDYPDDFPNPDLQGRQVSFHCRVDRVEQEVLPELDDAFAAQMQDGQTLLELRAHIREGLEADARKRIAQDLDDQVLDRLIERNEVPVPPSMVAAWLRSGVEDLRQRAAQVGREPTDEEVAAYREQAGPLAERQIKGMFLLEAVRKQESIDVSDADVEARVAEIAGEHGFDLDKYREFVDKGEEKDRIRHDLLERRTYDFLLSRAAVSPAAAEDEG